MLPLVFIIVVTAIKDGIEDYRRAVLDDEVNTSAVTKLGNWHNVNQPNDGRSWLQKLFGLGETPGKVTKGVRKLREKEASDMNSMPLERDGDPGASESQSSFDLDQSSSSYTYPPVAQNRSLSALTPDANGDIPIAVSSQYALSTRSHRSDGVINYDVQTPGTAQWERTLWKKLEVGDIVLLRDNEQVPADIAVLSTSDANGVCYVETKNLDGETNLKPRKALKATSSILSEEDIEHSAFIVDAEPPHPNLYSFNGVLKYYPPSAARPSTMSSETTLPSSTGAGGEHLEPVTINELLLRGCTMRNTKWIIGIVVFTGADTKIMLNGGDTPSKRSKIEKETNFNVVMNFFALIALCAIAGIANGFYYGQRASSGDFFYEDPAAPSSIPAINGFVTAM